MPAAKHDEIYRQIKEKITNGSYTEGDYLPSENELTKEFDCSRNTIRRAISRLTSEGYVQPQHGKGVRVIYFGVKKINFVLSGTEGFNEAATRYGHETKAEVITFTELVVDKRLSDKTNFPEGCEVYFIQRVRYIDNIAKMIDNNLYRKDLITGLTKEIASGSIFNYIENTLGMEITTIKRSITVEKTTPFDEKYINLEDYNCLAVITSRVYNNSGDMFEYTESRNRPDMFMFNTVSNKNYAPM